MRIFWTQAADESFAENISYLRSEWNETVITDFLEKTDAALISIEKNPLLFPAVNNRKVFRKCLISKQVSLYYKIKKDRIDLITFWNNYQDPKKLKFK
jgi:hypothetical protein